MEKKNNVARNIAIGVAVGAAVSMLKKSNREKVAKNFRIAKMKVNEFRENPEQLKVRVKDTVQIVSDKGRELVDSTVVKNTVSQLNKIPPAVKDTLKETRDMLNKKKDEVMEKMPMHHEQKKEEDVKAVAPSTDDLDVEKEPIVQEDGGMAEARELMMDAPKEEKTEEHISKKQDEPKSEKHVGNKNEKKDSKQTV